MKIFLKVFFILPFFFLSILTAQNLTNQERLEFYPHHAGDSWLYWWEYYDPNFDFFEAGSICYLIQKDTVYNEATYWLIGSGVYCSDTYQSYLERIDTVTGNVFRKNNLTADQIDCVDNVYADIGDTISIGENRDLLYCDRLVVESFRDTIINSLPTTIRKVVGLPEQRTLYFARNIGMLGYGENFWIDTACVNGVGYRNITDIEHKKDPVGNTFLLYQNYPNPFNPKTIISYELQNTDYVDLSIYNLLGQKVVTLVDKNQAAGEYRIQWDATGFASGLYLYRLETSSGYSQSRKLLLLK